MSAYDEYWESGIDGPVGFGADGSASVRLRPGRSGLADAHTMRGDDGLQFTLDTNKLQPEARAWTIHRYGVAWSRMAELPCKAVPQCDGWYVLTADTDAPL